MSSDRRNRRVSPRFLLFVTILLIVLLGTALRFHELNTDSLWGDEIFEALNAQKDLASMVAGGDFAGRPILVLTHLFMLVGHQEFLVRLSYAIMGILGVAMTYRVGKLFLSEKVGMISAFLLAISPFHIYYSQEARSYSLTALLALASLYCLYRSLQENKPKYWLGFAAVTALSLNNSPSTASVLASEMAFAGLILLWNRFSKSARQYTNQEEQDRPRGWQHRLSSSKEVMLVISLFLGVGVFLVSSGDWLSYLARIDVGVVDSGTGGSTPVLTVSGPFLRDLAAQFSAGTGLALFLFVGAFVLGLVSSALQRRWQQLLLALLWIAPPFLILPRISASAYFGPRHLIFILPIYLFFIAYGISSVGSLTGLLARRYLGAQSAAWSSAGLLLMVAILSWPSLPAVQDVYKKQKEDWRGAAQFLQQNARTGDDIVQLLVSPTYALPYYLDNYAAGSGEPALIVRDTNGNAEIASVPPDVWWAFFIAMPGNRLSGQNPIQAVLGSEFDIRQFYQVTIIRGKNPVADVSEYRLLMARMLLIGAQYDKAPRAKGYVERARQIYHSLPPATTALSGCPDRFRMPVKIVDTVLANLQAGKQKAAQDNLLTALALHKIVYPPGQELVAVEAQALTRLGDAALAAGQMACAAELSLPAITFYQGALEKSPVDAALHLDLARAYATSGQIELATQEFQVVLSLDPDPKLTSDAQEWLNAHKQ